MELYAILRRNGWATPEDLGAAGERSSAAGAERADDVRWIRSYAIEEPEGGLGTICIYEASSPQAIREHALAADLPATEIFKVAKTIVLNEDPVPAQA